LPAPTVAERSHNCDGVVGVAVDESV